VLAGAFDVASRYELVNNLLHCKVDGHAPVTLIIANATRSSLGTGSISGPSAEIELGIWPRRGATGHCTAALHDNWHPAPCASRHHLSAPTFTVGMN
jgi:hypothetical protein